MTRGRRAAIAFLIGAAAAAVHLGALDCGFITYDDGPYIYQNPHLRDGFTAASVRWAFTAHLTHNALPNLDYWQPLTVLSRLLDVEMFGLDPRGHHATNVLLHGLDAALLFLVLEAMTGAAGRSAFVAALFGVHPLRVESVVWVTERKDVLSGLLWMLALAAYVRYVRRGGRRAYALVVILFVLGLMAKPILVVFPFVLLLLDYWPLQRFGLDTPGRLRGLVVEKVPLFALAFASVAVTVFSQARGNMLIALETLPLSTRLGNAIVDYAGYARRLFWPLPLALPQPYPVRPWPTLEVAGCAAILALVSAAAVVQARRRPYLAVGWLWFVGALVPVIGIVQSGAQPIADRFTYIPHIGLAIAVTWGLADLLRAGGLARVAPPAAAAALAACAALTVVQTRHWHDSRSLFEHAVAVTRTNFAAHFNLGTALAAEGRVAEAAAQFEQTLAIKPDHPRAHNNLANLLAAQGRVDEAAEHYREALRLAPDYADAHGNFGLLLAARHRGAEARVQYGEALRLRPRSADTLYNLGRLDAAEGHIEDALRDYAAAAEADPSLASAYTARANLLVRAGRFPEAETEYRSALRVRPSDPDTRNNLGRLLALLGRPAEAMAEYEEAARLAPANALVQLNIGRLLLASSRPAEALARYDAALRLRPDSAEAHLERGQALSQLERGGEGCAEYAEALRLDPAMDDARVASRAGRCPPPS